MTDSNNFAKTEMMIRKPVQEVFESFINPDITTKFWFTKSSGRLEEGVAVSWSWEMYNLTVPVTVNEINPNKGIRIVWGEGKQKSSVEWEFKPIGQSKTFVTITNYDFQVTGDELLSLIRDSTAGFTFLISGAKAWLEYGIELNLVGDKFPKELMEK